MDGCGPRRDAQGELTGRALLEVALAEADVLRADDQAGDELLTRLLIHSYPLRQSQDC